MKPLKFIASLAISFSAALLGGLATVASISTWYAKLQKPFLNPPDWVFGPVWTLLYTLIGVSLFLIWTKETTKPKTRAYVVFAVQMVFNALWSVAFFGLHQPELGLLAIAILIVSTALTIKLFRPHSLVASNILIPYLAWICFAAYLNVATAILN